MSGILLIVSGPAGSGKNTVCERLMASNNNIVRAITTTTRQARSGEKDGVDYHFLSVEDFEKGIVNGDFYEWAKVHGRYYGTGKKEVLDKLASGSDVILIIDVQGAKTWGEVASKDELIASRLHSVFIRPESLDVIRERMTLRGDEQSDIEKRLQTAKEELAHEKYFEKTIVSATKDDDFFALQKLYHDFVK